jgi:c(7)-type cytochrome triheme protein
MLFIRKSEYKDFVYNIITSREVFMGNYLISVLIVLWASSVFASGGGGDIILKNSEGDVTFSHDIHVNGLKLACTECHDKLYTNSKQHKKVTMWRMRNGKSCGACHNGKKAFAVQGDCAKCHKK